MGRLDPAKKNRLNHQSFDDKISIDQPSVDCYSELKIQVPEAH